jgi:hypothetical protein
VRPTDRLTHNHPERIDMTWLQTLTIALMRKMRLVGGPTMPVAFTGQHTNPKKNAQRKLKREMGGRQFRKMRKYAQAKGR